MVGILSFMLISSLIRLILKIAPFFLIKWLNKIKGLTGDRETETEAIHLINVLIDKK